MALAFLCLRTATPNTTINPRRRRRYRRHQLKENTAEMFGIELAAEYEYKFSSAKVRVEGEEPTKLTSCHETAVQRTKRCCCVCATSSFRRCYNADKPPRLAQMGGCTSSRDAARTNHESRQARMRQLALLRVIAVCSLEG